MLLYLLADQPPSPSFWEDPLTLAILGAATTLIAGLIGAGVSYLIFRKQSIKKILSYQLVSNAPIAALNKTLQNRIKIEIDGVPVSNARQVVLKLRNEGNAAIKSDGNYSGLLSTCQRRGNQVKYNHDERRRTASPSRRKSNPQSVGS